MEASTQFSKEGLQDQAMSSNIKFPAGSHWEGNVSHCESEAKAAVDIPEI
jgi:hypothetical protein